MRDRRRVNVALSRAREKCIIVGDKNYLHNHGGGLWRSVIAHYSK